MGRAFGAVAQYLAGLCEPMAGPPFAMYYNMDMQNLDVEMGFPVARSLPGKGEVQASELPAGKVATCLYTGPYSEMPAAYEALTQWMKERGYEPTGIAYEMYLDDPAQTSPQALRTEIAFPLVAAQV